MKKLFLIPIFLMVGVGFVAAGTSGSIALSGTVAATLDVVVLADTGAGSLDLTASQSAKLIGTAKFTTNRASWKIKVYSTNGSKLMNGTEFLLYTFTLGGLTSLQGVTLGAGSTNATVQSMTAKTPSGGDTYNATIGYTGSSGLTEGSYTDSVTIEISAT